MLRPSGAVTSASITFTKLLVIVKLPDCTPEVKEPQTPEFTRIRIVEFPWLLDAVTFIVPPLTVVL
jgi:hypothetical protein